MQSFDLQNEILKVITDKVHGATFLQEQLFEVFMKYLLSIPQQKRKDALLVLQKRLDMIAETRPDLPSIYNAATFFVEELLKSATKKSLDDKSVRETRSLMQNLRETLNQRFIQVFQSMNQKARITRIITLSHSSTVIHVLRFLHAFLKNQKKEIPELLILESRPRFEGVLLAKELLDFYPVTVKIDVGFYEELTSDPEHTMVLLGADALLEDGIINKIGSAILSELAWHHHVRVIVVSSFLKRIKKTMKDMALKQADIQDAWEIVRTWDLQDAEKQRMLGTVRNQYFECIPTKYITCIITEVNEK